MSTPHFQRHPLSLDELPQTSQEHAPVEPGALRVAIVGAGPAACYAAARLLVIDGVEVNLFEQLPTPYGLIRAGVAPDHPQTKSISDMFDHAFADSRFSCYLNVEVGRDLSHDELLSHHHAVVYAVGAPTSRELDIPGEQLAGSYAAADFVGWYNGHPDHADHAFVLSTNRAVIIGNGNVALDMARILLTPAADLARTDISDYALSALADSKIEEVVILGRRGLREAAFSFAEFLALGLLKGVDVCLPEVDLAESPDDDVEIAIAFDAAHRFSARPTAPSNKRIVFRFLTSPVELVGAQHVEAVRVATGPTRDAGQTETIETSLVLRSIGYQGAPIQGLPFDPIRGVIPNDNGRVTDSSGMPVPAVYVPGGSSVARAATSARTGCAPMKRSQLFSPTSIPEG